MQKFKTHKIRENVAVSVLLGYYQFEALNFSTRFHQSIPFLESKVGRRRGAVHTRTSLSSFSFGLCQELSRSWPNVYSNVYSQMNSLENRNSSALFKRAEQLKRWGESNTNHEPTEPKRKEPRIQFTDGCVFLAACAASDKDEVEKLIKRGADIDTANIDGLTALHQVSEKL